MGEVTFETVAYSKIMLHAAKYPHCSVTGILLADATNIKDGGKNQELTIVDAVPLFHHNHYVSPMSEIALTQIETVAQTKKQIVAGYYAACENFRDNTVDKCPGQKIAEKIGEYFPLAVFVVVDNKKTVTHLNTPAIKVHKYVEGKWKPKEIPSRLLLKDPNALEITSLMLQKGVQANLVDFDNYLDDLSQDWRNIGIEQLIATINASFSVHANNM